MRRGRPPGSKNRTHEEKLAAVLAERAVRVARQVAEAAQKKVRQAAARERNRQYCRERFRRIAMAKMPQLPPPPYDEADYLRSIGAPAPSAPSSLDLRRRLALPRFHLDSRERLWRQLTTPQ